MTEERVTEVQKCPYCDSGFAQAYRWIRKGREVVRYRCLSCWKMYPSVEWWECPQSKRKTEEYPKAKV